MNKFFLELFAACLVAWGFVGVTYAKPLPTTAHSHSDGSQSQGPSKKLQGGYVDLKEGNGSGKVHKGVVQDGGNLIEVTMHDGSVRWYYWDAETAYYRWNGETLCFHKCTYPGCNHHYYHMSDTPDGSATGTALN